ncbi:RRM_1 domain-containing protein [Cephalotus follicularis]|uniref:RRM_1 domain-containing protein n=1 Tax=Cephalotus follicularis TaxID=3775 RepID=A0A1Q3DD86_CEPFO|nr:RRM_1 domain-containing protein [Cephalotus follicularis]
MATVWITSSSSSSSLSLLPIGHAKILNRRVPIGLVSFSLPHLLKCQWGTNKARVSLPYALLSEEPAVAEEINGEDEGEGAYQSANDDFLVQEPWRRARPCEVYVCNLPRSCDIPQLVDMFRPFGTVISVEISRNSETGVSRGSGYVIMGSIKSAKDAIVTLDGSDVGGRELRVRFSVEMNYGRDPEVLNSAPNRSIIYESPYKLYVGNLHRAVKPEDLRNYFSQFGTVVSAKVLHDRKDGKSRVFGFLSFSSVAERDDAISSNGAEFGGRKLVVREGVEKTKY